MLKDKSKTEHPIIFSAPMVRALLEGRKTQTRRPIKSASGYPRITSITLQDDGIFRCLRGGKGWEMAPENLISACPYGKVGDLLWVRECWSIYHDTDQNYVVYRADEEKHGGCAPYDDVWRPSIHMPREASRISLKITDIRVERVQEISEDDARAEGVERGEWNHSGKFCNVTIFSTDLNYRGGFKGVWNCLYNEKNKPKFVWDKNPWVWVVEFEVAA